MNRGGGRSGKSGRSVTPDEAELWSRVASSVDKVKSKSRVHSRTDETVSTPAPARRAAPEPGKSSPPRTVGPPPPSAKARLAPLAEFDRRAVRQVASGKLSIDARLDLHDMRQRDARSQLRAFLRAAQAKGMKTVLIITGKGDAAADRDHFSDAFGEPRRGVLRLSVPQWLEEPDLRSIVLSYTAAGTRHGGGGALYVQLRKYRSA